MFLRALLILSITLLPLSAWSKSLRVTTPFNHYNLNYSNDLIYLKSSSYQFSLKKKKCNQLLISNFVKVVNRTLKAGPLDLSQGDKPISIITEGKKYYADKHSRLGISLLRLPKEVRRLKIQEKMLCQKK